MVGLVIIGPGLAACVADDDRSDRSTESEAADEGTLPGVGGLGDDVPSGQPMLQESDLLEEDERAIIYEADLGVQVDDVEQATDDAVGAVEDLGGHLASRQSNYEDDLETDLTLKVPPNDLESAIDVFVDLGEVFRHDLESEDVTEQMVDLQGRLDSAEASAERLREMLAGAESTADLVELEGTLAEREANVESLQGQLSTLSGQVEMATIDLRLTENPDPEELGVSDDIPGFLGALRNGWVSLVNVVLVLLMAVGFLLPFSPFIAGGWWGYRRYRRSHPRPPSAESE